MILNDLLRLASDKLGWLSRGMEWFLLGVYLTINETKLRVLNQIYIRMVVENISTNHTNLTYNIFIMNDLAYSRTLIKNPLKFY